MKIQKVKANWRYSGFTGLQVSAFKEFAMGSNLTTGKGKTGKQILRRLKQRYCNNLKWIETPR